MEGFSKRNLLYMRRFAMACPEFPIGQAPLDQISWYHNITLLQKCPGIYTAHRGGFGAKT
jgi:hypothetical protein